MQISILKPGENRLIDLLSRNLTTKINSFQVGGVAGGSPNQNGTQVTGGSVYVGTPDQISYFRVSPNELVLKLVLDHDIGDFSVGNVIIFLDPIAAGQPPVPFLWAMLPTATPKNDSNLTAYVIGNRIIIMIAVWFPYVASILDMGQHAEEYCQMREYPNDADVPSVDVEEFDQVTISTHSQYDSMSMLIKDNKFSKWWGMAFSQYIHDPMLNTITGGIIGQEYGSQSQNIYYDGSNFKIDNAGFDKLDGGANWAQPDEAPVNAGEF